MVCLPFELRNWETAEWEHKSDSILKFTTIALGHCLSASIGQQYSSVLVTSGRHINIMDLHQRNTDSDCSWTITGMLLLFTFTKKASIVVNFDVDIPHLFTRLAGAILNSLHGIRVTGLFLQMRTPMDRH